MKEEFIDAICSLYECLSVPDSGGQNALVDACPQQLYWHFAHFKNLLMSRFVTANKKVFAMKKSRQLKGNKAIPSSLNSSTVYINNTVKKTKNTCPYPL